MMDFAHVRSLLEARRSGYSLAGDFYTAPATNDQDATLVAHNQRGVSSKGYRPGPYAPSEFMLDHFTDWYAGKLAGYLEGLPSRHAPIRLAVAQA